MATYANTTNQLAALKELYTGDDYLKDLVYPKNPLLALIPKDESPSGFAGKYIPVPVLYSHPQGRSATFATAQTNQTATSEISFFVYRTKNYQLVTIENELLEATKNDAAAFADQGKLQMDKAFRNIANDVGHDLFNDGSGSRGQISAISSGVITLTATSDVVNFEVGQVLQSYRVSGTTATVVSGGALGYVIAVNRTAGTVTVSATSGGSAGTPTNWSTSDKYLAAQGDVNFASGGLAAGSMLKIAGLGSWVPATAPTTGDSFWGVDRSVDVTRLAGLRYDGSAQTIDEALVDALALCAREGAEPDMLFINYTSYAALEKILGAKVQYVDVKHEEADIAFAGMRVHAPYGPVTIVPDRNCPAKTAFALTMSSWKLRSLGKAPHILTYGMEGLEGARVGTADALEIRIGLYGNLICNAPGHNMNIALSQ